MLALEGEALTTGPPGKSLSGLSNPSKHALLFFFFTVSLIILFHFLHSEEEDRIYPPN